MQPCSMLDLKYSLVNIYTVPKPVLDILAEMIAADKELNVGPFGSGPGSDRGLD
jgi:import receptor subunit TOM20